MALNIEAKKALVAEVNAIALTAHSAVAAEYRGLTVTEMTALRSEARNSGVYLKVVRNTLARRAVEGTEFECLRDSLSGPVLLAFSQQDPGSAARIIKEFSKEHDKLKAVSVSIGGELFGAGDLDRLASLPSLNEARSQLLSVFKAPLSQLLRTLDEPPTMLARLLQSRGDQ